MLQHFVEIATGNKGFHETTSVWGDARQAPPARRNAGSADKARDYIKQVEEIEVAIQTTSDPHKVAGLRTKQAPIIKNAAELIRGHFDQIDPVLTAGRIFPLLGYDYRLSRTIEGADRIAPIADAYLDSAPHYIEHMNLETAVANP